MGVGHPSGCRPFLIPNRLAILRKIGSHSIRECVPEALILRQIKILLGSIATVGLTMHRVVKALEPWGILLAVIGLGFSLWAFEIDREDRREDRKNREEDRVNRALAQFANGFGRAEAWSVLQRNSVDVSGLRARAAHLPGEDLSALDLSHADFESAQLRGAQFQMSDLTDTIFVNARMSDAELHGSVINRTDFCRADLSGINFAEAELIGANFYLANLANTDLTDIEGGLHSIPGAYLCSTKGIGSLGDRDCNKSYALWLSEYETRFGTCDPL